jgi:tRNA(Ile)-lysidine synthase
MLSRVQRTIREHSLIAPGDRVLCAVSGGPDSMALMHTLWELHARLGFTLEITTVDHGLRPQAQAEANQVARCAQTLDLPWHLVTVDVKSAHSLRKLYPSSSSSPSVPVSASVSRSLQDIARHLRLAALSDLARAIGADQIALGHQADDQAETVLFRILRGTGVRGLAGIPYRRDQFIRPLLDVQRSQILAYLRRRSISFVDDPSNADARFTRARLRHQVIPALRAENPRLGEALRALAADAARLALPPATRPAGPALNRRAAAVIERLRRQRGGTRRVDVAGAQVEIAYGRVTWLPKGPIAARTAPAPLTITGPGEYGWPGAPSVTISDGAPTTGTGAVGFDAEAIPGPLMLRSIRPGDRMRPRGGRGSRKLSDLLIDAKIARAARRGLPVLTTFDDQILFVPGLRPAELARPSDRTRRWLSVFSPPARAEPNRDDPETSV